MQRPVGRSVVGVAPVEAFQGRSRLLGALQESHPVKFEPRRVGEWSGLDAVIIFRSDAGEKENAPPPKCPQLVVVGDTPAERTNGRIELADESFVDPVLRGRTLAEDHADAAGGVEAAPGDSVVAAVGRKVLWSISAGQRRTFRVSLPPPELGEREVLRDLLRPGRWLSLLPLVQFLREVSEDHDWTAPPLRAALMFDDPNLHWPSYGRLRFRDLARHASRHGYHVSVAMVPLDGRFVHPFVGRLFRERADVLSLVMHGNDHTRLELYRDMPTSDRCALVAQAMRRSDSFERRHAIHVDRVMTSPHGLVADDAMAVMFSLGVEALTADWPFPWAPPDSPPQDWPLAGWEAAQMISGAFPVLPRYLFTEPIDDLVFRAFLQQPLISYGHHRAGLDLLGAIARNINGLGDVRWMSLEAIARSNYLTRKRGSTLHVRPFSRRSTVVLPEDVDELVVELPPAYEPGQAPSLELRVTRGEPAAPVTRTFAVDADRVAGPVPVAGRGTADILVLPAAPADPYRVMSPPWTPWPLLRRGLTEGRDRLPFVKQEI